MSEILKTLDKKIIGVLLGIAGILLWFAPWFSWEEDFMGSTQALYQNGSHIGGLAYVVLIMSALYAIVSWTKTYQLQLVFSGVQFLVCLIFAFNGLQIIAYGMILLLLVSAAEVVLSIITKKAFDKKQIT